MEALKDEKLQAGRLRTGAETRNEVTCDTIEEIDVTAMKRNMALYGSKDDVTQFVVTPKDSIIYSFYGFVPMFSTEASSSRCQLI
jgi:hypothetical protein